MRYELKTKTTYNPQLEDVVDFVMGERGITKEIATDLLLANRGDEIHYSHLHRIQEGVQLIIENLDKEMGIIIDPDVDGITSSVMLIRYLRRLNPKVNFNVMFHKGKTHGIHRDIDIPTTLDLLLVLDGGTNDCDNQEKVVENGTKILIIDHHQFEKDWREVDGCVVINNNSSPLYLNKSISGSGMVFKFLLALDDAYGVLYARDYDDLAGLGCISDNMDILEKDTRALMNYCVHETKNPMLKHMEFEKITKYSTSNITKVSWNIAPLINSVFRSGTLEDKQRLLEAFLSEDEEVVKLGLKTCVSCKGRQDREKKKAIEDVLTYIKENKLEEYPFLIIDSTELGFSKELSGVICNSIVNTYNRPVFIGRQSVVRGFNEDGECSTKTVIQGSMRNSDSFFVKNLKKYCLDTGLFNYCEGHNNAGGWGMDVENVPKLLELSRDISLGESKPSHLVDAIIPFKYLTHNDIISLGEWEKLWGTTMREPIFAITGIKVNNSKMEKKGAKGNILMFNCNGIGFKKDFLSKVFYENFCKHDMTSYGGKELEVDVIVKFKKNEWNGKVYAQLEIIDGVSRVIDNTVEEVLY